MLHISFLPSILGEIREHSWEIDKLPPICLAPQPGCEKSDKMAIQSVSVMGVSRSGTSLTANILAKMGFYVEQEGTRTDEHNVDGYWESSELKNILSQIQNTIGHSLRSYVSDDWLANPKLAEIDLRLQQLISKLESRDYWAWKNPILSFTFSYFGRFLPQDHKCIIAVRNPADVASSNNKAFGHNTKSTSVNWVTENLLIMKNTFGRKRLFVFYDDYFNNGEEQLTRISDFVGLPVNQEVLSLPKTERTHFRSSLDQVIKSPEATIDAKILYLLMLQLKKDPTLADRLSTSLSMGFTELGMLNQSLSIEESIKYRKLKNNRYVKAGLVMSRHLHLERLARRLNLA